MVSQTKLLQQEQTLLLGGELQKESTQEVKQEVAVVKDKPQTIEVQTATGKQILTLQEENDARQFTNDVLSGKASTVSLSSGFGDSPFKARARFLVSQGESQAAIAIKESRKNRAEGVIAGTITDLTERDKLTLINEIEKNVKQSRPDLRKKEQITIPTKSGRKITARVFATSQENLRNQLSETSPKPLQGNISLLDRDIEVRKQKMETSVPVENFADFTRRTARGLRDDPKSLIGTTKGFVTSTGNRVFDNFTGGLQNIGGKLRAAGSIIDTEEERTRSARVNRLRDANFTLSEEFVKKGGDPAAFELFQEQAVQKSKDRINFAAVKKRDDLVNGLAIKVNSGKLTREEAINQAETKLNKFQKDLVELETKKLSNELTSLSKDVALSRASINFFSNAVVEAETQVALLSIGPVGVALDVAIFVAEATQLPGAIKEVVVEGIGGDLRPAKTLGLNLASSALGGGIGAKGVSLQNKANLQKELGSLKLNSEVIGVGADALGGFKLTNAEIAKFTKMIDAGVDISAVSIGGSTPKGTKAVGALLVVGGRKGESSAGFVQGKVLLETKGKQSFSDVTGRIRTIQKGKKFESIIDLASVTPRKFSPSSFERALFFDTARVSKIETNQNIRKLELTSELKELKNPTITKNNLLFKFEQDLDLGFKNLIESGRKSKKKPSKSEITLFDLTKNTDVKVEKVGEIDLINGKASIEAIAGSRLFNIAGMSKGLGKLIDETKTRNVKTKKPRKEKGASISQLNKRLDNLFKDNGDLLIRKKDNVKKDKSISINQLNKRLDNLFKDDKFSESQVTSKDINRNVANLFQVRKTNNKKSKKAKVIKSEVPQAILIEGAFKEFALTKNTGQVKDLTRTNIFGKTQFNQQQEFRTKLDDSNERFNILNSQNLFGKQVELPNQKQRPRLNISQNFKLSQKQNQELNLRFNSRQTSSVNITTIIPKIPKIPNMNLNITPKKFRSRLNDKTKYDIFIKNKKVAKGIVGKGNANDLGSFVVDNSIAAQYRLKKSPKKQKVSDKINIPVNYFELNKNKFRGFQIVRGKPKKLKNKFIEKRNRRLDTSGESSQIKAAQVVGRLKRNARRQAKQSNAFGNLIGTTNVKAKPKKKRKAVRTSGIFGMTKGLI